VKLPSTRLKFGCGPVRFFWVPAVASNEALPGRNSGAGRTCDAQVWSLGRAEPGGRVEKCPVPGGAVVLVVDVVDDVGVVAGVVLVVDEVVVVGRAVVVDVGRAVVVGCAVVDDGEGPATTLKAEAPLFQCRNVPQPTLKIPILTVCTPSVSD